MGSMGKLVRSCRIKKGVACWMIKRLSLMLALLLLFSLPVFSAWGAEGDSSYSESGEDYSEDTNSDRSARRIPA